jgi:hypothetical protein
LHTSTFIIGFGDPVLGPTLIDALDAGCVFINPTYAKPHKLADIPAFPAHTQHDYGVLLGEPYVYTVAYEQPKNVLKVVRKVQKCDLLVLWKLTMCHSVYVI